MIFTKTASFESIISYGLLLISGAVIPFANMGSFFDKIKWIPYVFQISLAQKISRGNSFSLFDTLYVVLSNIFILLLGLLIYLINYKSVRKNGVMNRY